MTCQQLKAGLINPGIKKQLIREFGEAPLPVIVFNQNLTPVYANAWAYSNFGSKTSDLTAEKLQKKLAPLWIKSLRAKLLRTFSLKLSIKETIPAEFSFNNSDLTFEISSREALNILQITGIEQDNSQDSWEFALDDESQGFWRLDRCNSTLQISDTWIKKLDLPVSSLEFKPSLLKLADPLHRKNVLTHFKDLFEGRQSATTLDFKLLAPWSADECWVRLRARKITANLSENTNGLFGTLTDITEIKQNEDRLEYLAFYDPLTRLPNKDKLRESITQRLSVATRYQQYGALLHLDLDGFKLINDSLGHDMGDQLLQHVAQSLSSSIRTGDLLVRLGGDEFAILLGHQTEHQNEIINQSTNLARKVLNTVAKKTSLRGQQVAIGCSIGIAIFPDDGSSFEEIIKHSEIAMYRAKEKGKNGFHFYENKLETSVQRKLVMQTELRNAIHNNELILQYQPKICVQSGQIIGAEALVRWQAKDRMIPPNEFIPIAEENGLIVPLGDWVISNAIEQLSQWSGHAEFEHLKHVAINVSPEQLNDPLFSNKLRLFLNQHPGIEGKLEVEMTESAFISEPEKAKAHLDAVKAMGLTLAIDDFGTGYSMLSYLKNLPFDVIKIDRSFIRSIQQEKTDLALIKAIISMGKALEMKVVAEGVEVLEQVAELQELDCDYVQGFYYSPPVSAEEFWHQFLMDRMSAPDSVSA